MIEYRVGYRHSFKKNIKKFCIKNDIKIKGVIYFGKSKNDDYYVLSTEPEKIKLLNKFVYRLEKKRQKKNFWYIFFNNKIAKKLHKL